MRPLSRHCRRPTSEMFAGMLIAILLAGTSLAYADGASTSPATPLNDFRSQLGDVKKSLEGVNAKIEDRAKAIETLSKPDAARQQVEELQALVSQTLSLVADNGDIAKLGVKALEYARSKQDQMRKDTKFSATERAALQKRWDRNVAEMVKATDELSKASSEFAQLLKTIQTRGDYASEVLEVENAAEMVKVIQNLAGDVRGASEALKTFIRTITPPDA
jgi:DNA repair exonuclease SbcCD ATPase subunit